MSNTLYVPHNLFWDVDGVGDIGAASGSSRPNNIYLKGYLEIGEISAPSAATSGTNRFYFNSTDHLPHYVDSAGADHAVGTTSFPLLAPNGSASAPSYSFSASTGTGMYSSATNVLNLATNGVNRLSLSSNGTLVASGGAGGTTGYSFTHAATNAFAPIADFASNNSQQGSMITITNSGSSAYKYLNVYDNYLKIGFKTGGVTTNSAVDILGVYDDGSVKLEKSSGANLLWVTDASGNIGASGNVNRPNNIFVKNSIEINNAGTAAYLKINSATTEPTYTANTGAGHHFRSGTVEDGYWDLNGIVLSAGTGLSFDMVSGSSGLIIWPTAATSGSIGSADGISHRPFAAYVKNNVGIGLSATQDASSILQVDSTTKGVLFPRMTTTQIGAISSPAEGLLVYDNVLHAFYYYNGTVFTGMGGGGTTFPLLAPNGSAAAPSYSFSASTGTGMYSSATNILDFSTNGTKAIEISDTQNVVVTAGNGIGLTLSSTPTSASDAVLKLSGTLSATVSTRGISQVLTSAGGTATIFPTAIFTSISGSNNTNGSSGYYGYYLDMQVGATSAVMALNSGTGNLGLFINSRVSATSASTGNVGAYIIAENGNYQKGVVASTDTSGGTSPKAVGMQANVFGAAGTMPTTYAAIYANLNNAYSPTVLDGFPNVNAVIVANNGNSVADLLHLQSAGVDKFTVVDAGNTTITDVALTAATSILTLNGTPNAGVSSNGIKMVYASTASASTVNQNGILLNMLTGTSNTGSGATTGIYVQLSKGTTTAPLSWNSGPGNFGMNVECFVPATTTGAGNIGAAFYTGAGNLSKGILVINDAVAGTTPKSTGVHVNVFGNAGTMPTTYAGVYAVLNNTFSASLLDGFANVNAVFVGNNGNSAADLIHLQSNAVDRFVVTDAGFVSVTPVSPAPAGSIFSITPTFSGTASNVALRIPVTLTGGATNVSSAGIQLTFTGSNYTNSGTAMNGFYTDMPVGVSATNMAFFSGTGNYGVYSDTYVVATGSATAGNTAGAFLAERGNVNHGVVGIANRNPTTGTTTGIGVIAAVFGNAGTMPTNYVALSAVLNNAQSASLIDTNPNVNSVIVGNNGNTSADLLHLQNASVDVFKVASTGILTVARAAAPSAPASGFDALYFDSTSGLPSYMGSDGIAHVIGGTSFPLLAPDGSLAAPSYSFSSSSATGMYYSAGLRFASDNNVTMTMTLGGLATFKLFNNTPTGSGGGNVGIALQNDINTWTWSSDGTPDGTTNQGQFKLHTNIAQGGDLISINGYSGGIVLGGGIPAGPQKATTVVFSPLAASTAGITGQGSITNGGGTTTVTGTSTQFLRELGVGDEISLNGGTNYAIITAIASATSLTTSPALPSASSASITRRPAAFRVDDGTGTQTFLMLASGQHLASSGTAAAPIYSFSASTGTGMYSSASNILDFATNGSNRMEINASGDVSINGTASNSYLTIHDAATTGGKNLIHLMSTNNQSGVGLCFEGPTLGTDFNFIYGYSGFLRIATNSSNSLQTVTDLFQFNNSGSMQFVKSSGANITWNTDGAGNIGASGANRPGSIFALTNINLASLSASSLVVTDGSKNLISSSVSAASVGYLLNAEALQTFTLVDNTAANAVIETWAVASFTSIQIEYSINRNGTALESGYITLITDGTTVDLAKNEAIIGSTGITFDADVTGGNLRLLYTSTSTGFNATFKYTVRKWLA